MQIYRLPLRLISAALAAFAITAIVGTTLAYEGPPVPAPEELMTLVRETVLAVDAGNKSGDYAKLRAMGSVQFQAHNSPEQLASGFSKLRTSGIDLGPVRELAPLTTRSPTLDRDGRLRILGYFEFPAIQLVYDVLYDYDAAMPGWRLAAISLKPRVLPVQPELQPPQ